MQITFNFTPNYQALLIFVLFYFRLAYCFFINPIIFISFFTKQTNRPFFTTDINICVKQFIYISFFIAYILYRPFAMCCVLIWIISSTTLYSYKTWSQFRFAFVYAHILSVRFNQYDFINFYQNSIFNAYIEGVDLSFIILQYKGFFWDFFITLYAFISYIVFIFNFPKSSIRYIHNIEHFFNKNEKHNIRVLFYSWAARFFRYRILSYFFIGESYINDSFTLLFITIFVEFIFISFRFFFIQQLRIINENYVKLFESLFCIRSKFYSINV